MVERCPVCGHRFMREAGFFQGAMYISYVVGVVEFLALGVASLRFLGPRVGVLAAIAAAAAVHLALVPVLFQYSRAVWAHLSIGTAAKYRG